MRILFFLALLSACKQTITADVTDADNDGFTSEEDCNDADAAVNPGAAELCNGIDDDCNSVVDDDYATDAQVYFQDRDGDSFGNGAVTERACSAPAGFVSDDTDCDDNASAVNPDALETDCNDPVDYNCDGSVGFDDADGDGFAACRDCDDTLAAINPGAEETCDDRDNDCDGLTDEEGALGSEPFYADGDEDGFGDSSDVEVACDAPAGFVRNNTDCNDSRNDVNPDQIEVCDGFDNDCDGRTDGVDAVDATTWYADADSDGAGTTDLALIACDAPLGFVGDDSDCNDADGTVFPGADELCDDRDNNCDGVTDEGFDKQWYADADADSFGNPDISQVSCEQPTGFVRDNLDCNDTDDTAFPQAEEVCDLVDNDCDDIVDEEFNTTRYLDRDGDSFGDPGFAVDSCSTIPGFVANADDCDDSSDQAFPGGTEVCDNLDNNCNLSIDEGFDVVRYADSDRDGFGNPALSIESCEPREGFVANADDCDDSSANVAPSRPEQCDGVDNNCDDAIDEGFDSDNDGFTSCGGDCNDDDDAINPGATEDCTDVDRNCTGNAFDAPEGVAVSWFVDIDFDGFGSDIIEQVACTRPNGFVDNREDCNDNDAQINPDAVERCDGGDYNCDGLVDNDADGDGFADTSCGGDDCDDTAPDIFPEADGVCPLGATCRDILNNGFSTGNDYYFIDLDGPGFGDDAILVWCDMEDGGYTYADEGEWFRVEYSGRREVLTSPAVDSEMDVRLWGASGGASQSGASSSGGAGGYAFGRVAVSAGSELYLYIGGEGARGGGEDVGACTQQTGGFNGGGTGSRGGSGGGGGTDLRIGSDGLNDRVLVAGGGGGCGSGACVNRGGRGGGLIGENGANNGSGAGGTGGTQTAGGQSTRGGQGNGTFGFGGTAVDCNDSGGGGGGWYGGGGGGNANTTAGGGSGYVDGSLQPRGTDLSNNVGNGYAEYRIL